MKIIIGCCIFCLVLFLYLHIQYHYKTSEDLEIYEVDDPSKEKLEDICNLRQPVLFNFECDKIINTINRSYLEDKYPAFELKIRNINDTSNEYYITLPLHTASKLLNEDKSGSYFTEKNTDFLMETGVEKNMRYNDEFLRPYMVSNCNYDIMMGSNNSSTPFQYEINYRNFFLVTQGRIYVKLSPPHNKKYLYPHYDYENFEFRSQINIWKPEAKYISDVDKIKCLEFIILPGKTLYIPPYWWYSIQFLDNASISCFRYRTYMNNLAILPYICMHGLQLQNIKFDISKKISPINNENPSTIAINMEENFDKGETTNIDELPHDEIIEKSE